VVDSRRTLGQIFDASPSAMLLVSAGGQIRLANVQAERLFGYRRGELIGTSVERLVPERFRAHHPAQRNGYFADPVARAMGEGRDLFGLRADGSEVPIEIGLNPIDAGEGTFVLVAIIDISARKRSEAMLRASLAEKETLLREIHHRVKNNMQVVSSLLNLQLSAIDEPRYRGLFEECQTRVRTMALIHEKLYSADNLALLDGADYVRSLVQMLFRTYQPAGVQVQLDLQVDAVQLTIQTAIPVGLILHELVTNAMKHAFVDRQHGRLRVLLTQSGDRGQLEVADDGRGLPPELEPARSRGLGFRMIGSLVRQLDGSLVVHRGDGSRMVVEFEQRAFAGPLP
jgi:two-component system, sensor histidine kinase PdtaS